MSLTSYRAAPPRDSADGFYNGPALFQRKRFSEVLRRAHAYRAPQRGNILPSPSAFPFLRRRNSSALMPRAVILSSLSSIHLRDDDIIL
jgi:hypothetical protein